MGEAKEKSSGQEQVITVTVKLWTVIRMSSISMW